MRAGLNPFPIDRPVHPPLRMRFCAWLWGAIEFAALWRARWRVRHTGDMKRL